MYRISCIVKTSLPPLDVSHCSLGWLLSAVCRPALHTAGRKVWGGGGARSRGRCPMSVTSGTGHRLSGCDRAAERPAVSCGRCPMLVTSGTGRRPAAVTGGPPRRSSRPPGVRRRRTCCSRAEPHPTAADGPSRHTHVTHGRLGSRTTFILAAARTVWSNVFSRRGLTPAGRMVSDCIIRSWNSSATIYFSQILASNFLVNL